MTLGLEMMWGMAGLLAAAEPRRQYGSAYYAGLAVVAVVVLIAVVGFYRVWREVREEEEPDSPEEVLESFRRAHAAGEIDDRELERVTSVLRPGKAQPRPRPEPRPRKPDTVPDALDDPYF